MEAVERNGVLRGSAQAAWRFLRCNPFGGHGYDPVDKCNSTGTIAHEEIKSFAGEPPALQKF